MDPTTNGKNFSAVEKVDTFLSFLKKMLLPTLARWKSAVWTNSDNVQKTAGAICELF